MSWKIGDDWGSVASTLGLLKLPLDQVSFKLKWHLNLTYQNVVVHDKIKCYLLCLVHRNFVNYRLMLELISTLKYEWGRLVQ